MLRLLISLWGGSSLGIGWLDFFWGRGPSPNFIPSFVLSGMAKCLHFAMLRLCAYYLVIPYFSCLFIFGFIGFLNFILDLIVRFDLVFFSSHPIKNYEL